MILHIPFSHHITADSENDSTDTKKTGHCCVHRSVTAMCAPENISTLIYLFDIENQININASLEEHILIN